MKIAEVQDRTPELLDRLLRVWEASVRATHLFLSEEEIGSIREYVPQALEGIVVNLLLTLPIGYLLPQLLPLTAVRAVLLGAGVSLCIELIQLITRLGMFELDDLIYNTLGVALGYGLLVCMEKRTGERLRR